ncbi:hypothetical protein EON66_12405 [archaeon]|nr:MAG: hypothetical protein EON66_12405 [archaeon]
MRALLGAGAVKDVTATSGRTPLQLTCRLGCGDCMRSLLAAGAHQSAAVCGRGDGIGSGIGGCSAGCGPSISVWLELYWQC